MVGPASFDVRPAPPPPPKRSNRAAWIFGLLFAGSLFANLLLMLTLGNLLSGGGSSRETLVDGKASAVDKILVLPVHGLLIESSPPGTGRDAISLTSQALRRAEEDEHVRAIVFDINSPGGGITDCDRLRHRLQMFRKKRPEVPVLTSMGDVAASGGYYLAASTDWIAAHRSTITGSIGVIMHLLNVEGLVAKVGVREDTVQSGVHKDIGSPFRAMTPEERMHFQGMINAMYEQFLSVVLEGRKGLTREQLLPLADGNVLTGETAVKAGLVDAIGYLDDVIEEARRRAGAPEAKAVRLDPQPSLADLFGLQGPSLPFEASMIETLTCHLAGSTARLMYLWRP